MKLKSDQTMQRNGVETHLGTIGPRRHEAVEIEDEPKWKLLALPVCGSGDVHGEQFICSDISRLIKPKKSQRANKGQQSSSSRQSKRSNGRAGQCYYGPARSITTTARSRFLFNEPIDSSIDGPALEKWAKRQSDKFDCCRLWHCNGHHCPTTMQQQPLGELRLSSASQ